MTSILASYQFTYGFMTNSLKFPKSDPHMQPDPACASIEYRDRIKGIEYISHPIRNLL